jgi:hypothetical protein
MFSSSQEKDVAEAYDLLPSEEKASTDEDSRSSGEHAGRKRTSRWTQRLGPWHLHGALALFYSGMYLLLVLSIARTPANKDDAMNNAGHFHSGKSCSIRIMRLRAPLTYVYSSP